MARKPTQGDKAMKTKPVQFTEDDIATIEKIAAAEDRSFAYMVRRFVRDGIEAWIKQHK